MKYCNNQARSRYAAVWHLLGITFCFIWVYSATARADVLIGQTIGVTGAVASTVQETIAGAQLYLAAVNEQGGVHGEKIRLITLDDKFDPKLAYANARELIEEQKVLALFLTRGTPHNEGIFPLLEQHRVALIAPSTGAVVMRKPLKRYVFNVRAAYQLEAEKAVAHLVSVGFTRIGVVQVDDSFGADAVVGVNKGLATHKLQAEYMAKFDRSKPDFSQIAVEAAKRNLQAMLMLGSGTAIVDGIKAIKRAGSTAQFVTLSNNASEGFVKQLGSSATGVIVTQVFPQSQSFALVRELKKAAQAKGMEALSPAVVEGYTAAKVLVEALRRAGSNPTRKSVVTALETLRNFDLGGLELNYSPDDHTGLGYTDLSIINADGRFSR